MIRAASLGAHAGLRRRTRPERRAQAWGFIAKAMCSSTRSSSVSAQRWDCFREDVDENVEAVERLYRAQHERLGRAPAIGIHRRPGTPRERRGRAAKPSSCAWRSSERPSTAMCALQPQAARLMPSSRPWVALCDHGDVNLQVAHVQLWLSTAARQCRQETLCVRLVLSGNWDQSTQRDPAPSPYRRASLTHGRRLRRRRSRADRVRVPPLASRRARAGRRTVRGAARGCCSRAECLQGIMSQDPLAGARGRRRAFAAGRHEMVNGNCSVRSCAR